MTTSSRPSPQTLANSLAGLQEFDMRVGGSCPHCLLNAIAWGKDVVGFPAENSLAVLPYDISLCVYLQAAVWRDSGRQKNSSLHKDLGVFSEGHVAAAHHPTWTPMWP
jgi:hypothetical protein